MIFLIHIVLPIIIAMIIGMIMIPKIVLISKRKKIYDAIDKRKSHDLPTSRLGGLIFLPSMLAAISASIIIDSSIFSLAHIAGDISQFAEFTSIILGVVLLYSVGFIDDFIGVSYQTKFALQFIVALFVVAAGFRVTTLDGVLGADDMNMTVSYIFTIIAFVGLINSYNLIDGIDGLCGGIAAITMAMLIYWFSVNHLHLYTVISSAFLGTCLVFLRFNLTRGRFKLFMGDTGSLIVGFVTTTLLLKLITHYQSMPSDSSHYIENYLVIIFSVIFVPCIDTIRVFIWREMRGKKPFKPDRTHLHHLIIDRGVAHKKATVIILLSIILNVAITLLLSTTLSSTLLFLSLIVYGSAITYGLPILYAKIININK